jgi:tetratricopeptide (TPR) repeat protein
MADPPQKTVFISYRRMASSYVAQSIFLDLRVHGYDVFKDIESIDSGPLNTIILNQIAARAHFLLICAPGTFERCAEPGDWLRREIEEAIDQGRNIVPVLANGFDFALEAHYMTGKLAELPSLSGLLLVYDYFDAGMERLRDRFLKQPVLGTIKPMPAKERPAVAEKIEKAAAEPAPTQEQLSAEEYASQAYQRAKDDLDGKIADYSEAIRLDPEYATAYYNRGAARYRQGDLDGTIADFDEAIRLDPENGAAYYNRGSARGDKGDLDGAIADFDEAIRLDPENAAAFNNRGIARRKQGNLDGAIADFTTSIDLKNPDLHLPYTNRGNLRGDKGDLVGAIADYGEAIRLDPEYDTAYYNRGVARYRQADLEGAIADYGEVIRLEPEGAAAYSNRGESAFALGRHTQARADFEQALKLDPHDKYALAGMAITLHALGEVEPALARWRALIEAQRAQIQNGNSESMGSADAGYRDADWVGKELNWRPELIAEARKLIARL